MVPAPCASIRISGWSSLETPCRRSAYGQLALGTVKGGRAVSPGRRRLAGRDRDQTNQLAVAVHRHGVAHEIRNSGANSGYREIGQAERSALDDRDCLEPDVEELLQQHWLRQCTGQSTGERRRTFQHFFRQRLGQHQIRDRHSAARPEDAHGLR